MVYAFYEIPTKSEQPEQRPLYDSYKIAIYLVRTELTLLFKYKEYEDVFSKEEYKIISEKTGVIYAINLKEGNKPPHNLIYALLERELRILREYLTKKEAIGWI